MNELRNINKCFHESADDWRYRNRLDNPFIEKKEKRLAGFIVNEMNDIPGHVLEIGCGEGSNYKYLRELIPNMQYVGLDLSYNKVKFVKTVDAAASVVCGDACSLPFPSSTFDAVICRDVLHHVDHARDSLMAEAMRVLKDNGKLFLLESNGNALINRLFRIFYPAERGMKNSTPDSLSNLCARFGQVRFFSLESSFLIRAVGFIVGWPRGFIRYACYPVYAAASLWEKIWEFIAPKRKWIYMMFCVCKA